MTQYIDKSTLVAEIKRRKEINKYRDTNDSLFEDEAILSFIDTLEVKEVDFKEELDEWMKYGPHTSYPWCTIPDAIEITAEHFFELGLKTQKGK